MQFVALGLLVLAMFLAVLFLPVRKGRADQPPAAAKQPAQQAIAMCYSIAIIPEVTEYVCPECGEKTIYSGREAVIESIPDCRRQLEAMRQVTRLGLELDESFCCEKCHPVTHSATLSLVITYPDKTRLAIDKITFDDLKRFHKFLVGKLSADEFVKQSKQFTEAMARLRKELAAEQQKALVDKASMRSMSLDELKALLRTIETSKAPKADMGAMCYSVASGPETIEYVCPECGEKTLYGKPAEPELLPEAKSEWEELNANRPKNANEPPVLSPAPPIDDLEDKQEQGPEAKPVLPELDEGQVAPLPVAPPVSSSGHYGEIVPEGSDESWKFWQEIWGAPTEADKKLAIDEERMRQWDNVRFIDWEVPRCRREIQAIRALRKLDVTLDESACCAKCSPQSTGPSVALVITYHDGSTYRISSVSDWDLRMIRDLLRGKLSAETFNEGSIPLKEELPRLRKLLGIDRPVQEKTNDQKPPQGPTP